MTDEDWLIYLNSYPLWIKVDLTSYPTTNFLTTFTITVVGTNSHDAYHEEEFTVNVFDCMFETQVMPTDS